jgi:hypothetical protein
MTSADLTLLQTKRALLVSGLFDPAFYRATYADLRTSPVDPLTHYVTRGEAEGRSPNAVFSPRYYRRRCMTGLPAERNALAHYAEEGERLGLKPNPGFDPQAYLGANPPLAEFVDRPLFHYLKIGRAAGLPVAPGPRGEALARLLAVQPHATDFEGSGRRNHYQLMRYKQALVRELGIEDGFAFYKEALSLPGSDRIERKPVASLHQFARDHGAVFQEIAPAGEPFAIAPPKIIGASDDRPIEGVSRAIFVACLIDARVRAHSGLIEVEDKALLDFQGDELARDGAALEGDPAVFHAADGAAWITRPADEASTVELDEAFMLLGPHSDDFDDWMVDFLPRYIAASASGALPPVPVLIDERLPAAQRQCLELMLPEGADILTQRPHATTRVRRLWCAASQMHVPLSPGQGDPPNPGCLAAPPARFAEIICEMARRIEPTAAIPTGQDRVYLAPGRGSPHAPVNAAEIAAAAAARGFAVVNPEELGFAEQVRLVRHAQFIVMSEARQVLLSLFAQREAKLLHLCDPYTAELPLRSGLLDETGVDVRVMTGSYLQLDDKHPEKSNYRIDAGGFCESIDAWLGDQDRAERLLPRPGMPNVFTYWDKPNLTPIRPTLDDWRSHFANFCVLSDPDIEPLLEELFPQHLEMFRRIRMPTAKSDVALLLMLYKFGGLHIDCHCGVRDAPLIRELLRCLDHWEVILYDKTRADQTRPATEINCLNSVLFARQNSSIILETLETVMRHLDDQWSFERNHGYRPYHIAQLTLPGSLGETLLIDAEAPISRIKPEYLHRVRFLQEGPGEPIGRYMHYRYRAPGMHWSERQEHELLFD